MVVLDNSLQDFANIELKFISILCDALTGSYQ